MWISIKSERKQETLLELYFDQEIAPLISPTVVGRRTALSIFEKPGDLRGSGIGD